MPRGRAKPNVRAADARVAQASSDVMATLASRAAAMEQSKSRARISKADGSISLDEIADASAEDALDTLSALVEDSDPLLAVDWAPRCLACLERCEDLWSDDERDQVLPHDHALKATAQVMLLALQPSLPYTNFKKLFGYSCMLLSAVIEAVQEDEADEEAPPNAAVLLAAAEETLASAGMAVDSPTTFAALLAKGLEVVLERDASNADLALLMLRALRSLADGLALETPAADMAPCASEEGAAQSAAPPVAMVMADADVAALIGSRALAMALETARAHASSLRVHSCLTSILYAMLSGGPAERRWLPAAGSTSPAAGSTSPAAGAEAPTSLCDALVCAGVLAPVVHALGSFAADEPLASRSMRILDALTRTEGGRRAAQELGAVRVLGELRVGDAERQREARVLGAFIASGEGSVEAVLSHLGLEGAAAHLGLAPAAENNAGEAEVASELLAAPKLELPRGAAAAEQMIDRVLAQAGHSGSGCVPGPEGQSTIEWGSGECAGVARYWY